MPEESPANNPPPVDESKVANVTRSQFITKAPGNFDARPKPLKVLKKKNADNRHENPS